MKFLRRPSGGDQKKANNNNNNPPQMGQFSSSEVQAASTVAGKAVLSSASAVIRGTAENVSEMRGAGNAKQEQRAHSLASAAPFRPSQPIDIRGKARPRAPEMAAVHQYRQPLPNPLQEAAEQLQHQPRVIQPRRLSGSPSASLGPMRSGGATGHGRNDLNTYRERVWQEAMRRRLLSLDSRVVDPECPSFSGGDNNKENQRRRELKKEDEEEAMEESSRKLSRKRLNSAELEYNGNGREDSSELEEKEPQKECQQQQRTGNGQCSPISPEKQARQQSETLAGQAISRRPAGRIAYLYGVYGQERLPYSHQMLFAQQQQQQRTTIEDGGQCRREGGILTANGTTGWTTAPADDYCWEERRQTSLVMTKDQHHQQQQLCYSDCEDDCLEMDSELELLDQDEAVTRLHTVSDIIGYAKVVRAQRQETLGRLNDVMSQFDALIRSYSMAMKTSGQQSKEEEAEECDDEANAVDMVVVDPTTTSMTATTAATAMVQQVALQN